MRRFLLACVVSEEWGRGGVRVTRGPVLAAGVGAASHVGDDGTDVGVRPEGPAEGHGRASGRGGVELRGLGAGIALDGGGCHILDGAVAGDGAGDPVGLDSYVNLSVSRG
jgi:hypothetical protein